VAGDETLLVQYGYRVFKGSAFADQLTASLAKEYANPSPAQILLGGVTAAWGEEVFFRGFIQQWLGLIVASLLFMVAHFAEKTSEWLATGQYFRACTSAFSLPTQRT
jgi:membrane protease YdiL (CAAX protease family)